MSSSEVILRATLEVFADEYRVTDADLGPHGEDLDARVLAAVVAYEAGANSLQVADVFGCNQEQVRAVVEALRATPEGRREVLRAANMVLDKLENGAENEA